MEDGGRLAPMAAELIDRLAILVAFRRFLGMGAANSHSLRFDIYVRMCHFVRRTAYVPFRRFWGDGRRELMQRLCAPLHGTLDSYLRDALQKGSADAGHVFLFLGLRFFPLFFFSFGGLHCFFFKIFFISIDRECFWQFTSRHK
jgi:hypothetical protein